jgi:hypothetical protein
VGQEQPTTNDDDTVGDRFIVASKLSRNRSSPPNLEVDDVAEVSML